MLTDSERAAVENHHDWAIETALAALATLRKVPPENRTVQVLNHIAYWRSVSRGFRWSKSFIGKNLKVKSNGTAGTIR